MENVDSWKLKIKYLFPEDKETVKEVEGRTVNGSKKCYSTVITETRMYIS